MEDQSTGHMEPIKSDPPKYPSLVWIAVGIWVMIGGQCASAILSQ